MQMALGCGQGLFAAALYGQLPCPFIALPSIHILLDLNDIRIDLFVEFLTVEPVDE